MDYQRELTLIRSDLLAMALNAMDMQAAQGKPASSVL